VAQVKPRRVEASSLYDTYEVPVDSPPDGSDTEESAAVSALPSIFNQRYAKRVAWRCVRDAVLACGMFTVRLADDTPGTWLRNCCAL
jgi:hypothetical protein